MIVSDDVGDDTDTEVRRYSTGLVVLLITVFLSNVFGFLRHPEQVFDVLRNSPLESGLHVAGFVGQLVTGLWLGVSLVFDVRRGQRLAAAGWLLSVVLFFVPMPSAGDDLWLTPVLMVLVTAVAWVSRALAELLPPRPA